MGFRFTNWQTSLCILSAFSPKQKEKTSTHKPKVLVELTINLF